MFGWALIRSKELKEYERRSRIYMSLIYVRDWFSGWSDLRVIWDYVFSDTYYGSIDSARRRMVSSELVCSDFRFQRT